MHCLTSVTPASVTPTTATTPTTSTTTSSESQTAANAQRKRLEWELSLSSSDMRSHGWFHGSIARSNAERLLENDGQFLVRLRSSSSNTARNSDYVLSCRSVGHCLHFMINKVILQPNTVYERLQYTFEDECFDTIADLITYYVGNKRFISMASNAVITTPVNRLLALSIGDDEITDCNTFSQISKLETNRFTAEDRRAESPPPPKPSRIPKCVPSLSQSSDRNCLAEVNQFYVNENEANASDKSNSSSNNSNNSNNSNALESNDNEGSHESDDSAFFSDTTKRVDVSDEYSGDDERPIFCIPEFETAGFSIEKLCQNFHTYLLSRDNRPLDQTAITKIHSVLHDSGSRILANHLTKCDLEFIGHLNVNRDFGFGIRSGLELILLPNGEQMRLNILDRHECMRYFVAVTILTASDECQRAVLMNKWIQIANETKTANGDLFGFASIMCALSMPAICRLTRSWARVRHDFTDTAITYETKLKPQLKSMESCNEPQAPNTTFPFVLTLLQILQRHQAIVSAHQNNDDVNYEVKALNFCFEQTATDYGVETIHQHLLNARQYINQLPALLRNGNIVLDGSYYEELLCDMFRTEFHRQFLFGFRGSTVSDANEERFTKLDKIVAVLTRSIDAE